MVQSSNTTDKNYPDTSSSRQNRCPGHHGILLLKTDFLTDWRTKLKNPRETAFIHSMHCGYNATICLLDVYYRSYAIHHISVFII